MNKNSLSTISDSEEVVADTRDGLEVESRRVTLDHRSILEDEAMNAVASGFKQCERDFELLRSDYERAVSDKMAANIPRLSERASRLIKRADELHAAACEAEPDSNSRLRGLMETTWFNFTTSVRSWKAPIDNIVSQLGDGAISETTPDHTGACGSNLKVSSSGDIEESHLFTRVGKDLNNNTGEEVKPTHGSLLTSKSAHETARKPLSKYSLDFLKVADISATAMQLKLLGYLRRSANAILGLRTNTGSELFYIGSITNNLIIPRAYHAVKPIFDTARGTYFLCTIIMPKPEDLIDDSMNDSKFFTIFKYIYLSHIGEVEEIAARINSHRFTEESTFKIGNREEQYPEASEDFATDAIFQSGQLLWVSKGNIKHLINSELGTTLGYSVSINLSEKGLVKLDGVPKVFLSRPSLSTIVLRDEGSEKEEYVSMKAKLIFERNAPYVIFIGGIVFVGPHGTKTTVSTFLPYEVEFGNVKSLDANNYREFSNGVLFLKDRLLFIDSGDYIVQMSLKDLEQGIRGVVCINDTLFITDKVGSI